MEPDPVSATLTLDAEALIALLRPVIEETVAAALAALSVITGVDQNDLPPVDLGAMSDLAAALAATEIGKTPDLRGMTCAQAVSVTGKPCVFACTHDLGDPSSPSTIVDPDCFR